MFSHNNKNYFVEIDGLRAIAVLGVVLFHFFPYYLSGGFVGVDVFFVISGFLVTRIIYNLIQKECFTFLGFYKKEFVDYCQHF